MRHGSAAAGVKRLCARASLDRPRACRPGCFARAERGLTAPAPLSTSSHSLHARQEGNVISRHWRGLAQADRAQDYVHHLRTETFPGLRKIPGFVDASILSRRLDEGVEFLVVTRWTSLEAVVRFAGADPAAAVVPEEVAAMMIDYDRRARHFDIIA
jgi:hypothetical protein